MFILKVGNGAENCSSRALTQTSFSLQKNITGKTGLRYQINDSVGKLRLFFKDEHTILQKNDKYTLNHLQLFSNIPSLNQQYFIVILKNCLFFKFLLSVGPQLLYPSPYVTPPVLMPLHPPSAAGAAGAAGVSQAAAAAAAAAAVASGFYDYPAAYAATAQFAAANGFDASFPFGGAAAAAAAAGIPYFMNLNLMS